MPILVLGATSQIGYYTLRRLTSLGHDVIAVSRYPQPRTDSRIRWQEGGLERLGKRSHLDAIVSYGPLLGLAQWLSVHDTAPAPRLVATSSMSVVTKQHSAVASERAVVAELAAGEARVQAECLRLGMACVLLRPTMVYGAGRDRNLTPIARRSERWRVAILPTGKGRRQPVHADDLSLAVECLLSEETCTDLVLSIGGGEQLTATQMFRRLHAVMPERCLAVSAPQGLLRLGARVLPALRGPISRLSDDLVADNTLARQVLGFEPRGFVLEPCMLGLGNDWQAQLDARPLRQRVIA